MNDHEPVVTQAVECCPWCGCDNIFDNYDVQASGYVVQCQHCGEPIMLCDECRHADDNPDMECDWAGHTCSQTGMSIGFCMRGKTTHKEKKDD